MEVKSLVWLQGTFFLTCSYVISRHGIQLLRTVILKSKMSHVFAITNFGESIFTRVYFYPITRVCKGWGKFPAKIVIFGCQIFNIINFHGQIFLERKSGYEFFPGIFINFLIFMLDSYLFFTFLSWHHLIRRYFLPLYFSLLVLNENYIGKSNLKVIIVEPEHLGYLQLI